MCMCKLKENNGKTIRYVPEEGYPIARRQAESTRNFITETALQTEKITDSPGSELCVVN